MTRVMGLRGARVVVVVSRIVINSCRCRVGRRASGKKDAIVVLKIFGPTLYRIE